MLKFDQHESDALGAQVAGKNPLREQITESVLVAKVARLTNDGSNVGPGAYNTIEAHKAQSPSPRHVERWKNNKSTRPDIFISKNTTEDVGPASYNINMSPDRAIRNPTIPRAGKATTWTMGQKRAKRRRNNGSIRADFEENSSSDDDYCQPGPGEYLREKHTSQFSNEPNFVHDNP